MNYEEVIETLRQIMDEALDDLNRRGRHYKAEQWGKALSAAIGAIYKQQDREREYTKNIWRL